MADPKDPQASSPHSDSTQSQIFFDEARYLERQGLLERDADSSYLALENLDEDASAMPR